MLKLGLIGCGAIGTALAKAIKNELKSTSLEVAFDADESRLAQFCRKFKHVRKARSFNELISHDLDLVIEAASQNAVRQFGATVLAKTNLMVMSSGSLLDPVLYRKLAKVAKANGRKIYIPSGAICGIDGIKAGSLRKISNVLLTTTKPALTLNVKIKNKKVVFSGSAHEAVKLFPQSVNVAATLSLASVGGKKTRVKVVADPNARNNMHEILVKGEAGEIYTRTTNVPFKENPKTSYLAALSAIRMLRNMSENIVVGT